MKKVIAVSLFSFLLFYSCIEESQFQEDQTNSFNPDAIITKQRSLMSLDIIESISQKMDEIKTAQLNSLTAKKKNSDCQKTVFVPDDYPTIQEALFAVCENGKVFVRSGVYNESPGTDKEGLFIKAIGDVTLNGGFGLGANNIKIHNFKIDNTTSIWGEVGIASESGSNGFDIKGNTIYGSGHLGIYLPYCDNASIVQNQISGDMEAGIFIDAFIFELFGIEHPFGGNTNNTITNNTVTNLIADLDNFYPAYGIVIRGDTDNTRIQGNTVNTTNGWGISLESWAEFDLYCDNNIVKNNVSTNNALNGLEVFGGGSNNVIGPNNECYDNDEIGIHLYAAKDFFSDFYDFDGDEGPTNNYVFNNSAFNNGICDIVDEGSGNSFKNNNADCTVGLE